MSERTPKYAPLGNFLAGLPKSKSEITLGFADIEEIIADALPSSASQYPGKPTSRTAISERQRRDKSEAPPVRCIVALWCSRCSPDRAPAPGRTGVVDGGLEGPELRLLRRLDHLC